MTRPPSIRGRFDYTRGPISRGLLRLAALIFVELISWNVDTILEVFWVGRLGADSLAAMSLGFMMISFVRAVGMGIRIPAQALVAQRIGADDAEGAAVVTGQTILLSLMFMVPISVAGVWLSPHLISLFTSDADIIRLGTGYMTVGFTVVLFVDSAFTLASVFRGAGEAGFSLASMMTGTLVTFGAMPLFIFGVGPLPGFHLAGANMGLGLGRTVSVIIMLAIFFSGRSRVRLRLRHLRPRADYLRRHLSLGWPAGGQQFFERGANFVLVGMLSWFGATALAAWGVGNRVNLMGRMPGFSFQGSVRTLVGQNIGAGLPVRARRAAWMAIVWVALIASGVAFALFLGAETVTRFFGVEGEAARPVVYCVQILNLGVGFEATRRAISGVFEGAAMTKPPMLVEAAVRWGVQIPGAYAAAVLLGFAEAGVWWSVAGSQALGGLVLFVWFAAGWWGRVEASGSVSISPESSPFPPRSSS